MLQAETTLPLEQRRVLEQRREWFVPKDLLFEWRSDPVASLLHGTNLGAR